VPLRPHLAVWFFFILPSGFFVLPAHGQDLGLKVAPGFRVTLFADAELANDIYAMTLDSQGRVVVTSRGWVKRLEDTDGDGKAHKATLLLETKTGGMGMCFDGDDLYFSGDGWVSRYHIDPDGKQPVRAPERQFFRLAFSEHGGHAIRKGPDGYFYVVGGNDAGVRDVQWVHGEEIKRLATLPPIQRAEGGGIIRFSPTWPSEAPRLIASGFRNPYDFDFTPLGDIITYDSDTERDFLLPWYSPTRIYHVAEGQHHGWRLSGYLRSLARRDYYADTVDVLAPIGRGSPTGVVCYRHTQFPEHYRGGVFALDWTFGKVYFLPLIPEGSSYRTKPEVFLESVGNNGFDPTDICVARDGSLFICMGGRGTRGGVFRVEYVGNGKDPAPSAPKPESQLLQVLDAPQPLDAWSRAIWGPIAGELGDTAFLEAVQDTSLTDAQRIRAIEILVARGAFRNALASFIARRDGPLVRARLAWAIGRSNARASSLDIQTFVNDPDPRVRVQALTGLVGVAEPYEQQRVAAAVRGNLGHADKRVRLAAMRLAATLPEKGWRLLDEELKGADTRTRLSAEIAALWRKGTAAGRDSGVLPAVEILESSKDVDLCLDAIRVIMLAYGDWDLASPPAEVYSAYSLPVKERLTQTVLAAARKRFPSGTERLDIELSRLLAMFEDGDPKSVAKVLAQITAQSPPTRDVHYLIVLARLKAKGDPGQSIAVANAVLGLEKKLQGLQLRIKQTWDDRLGEVISDLLKKHSGLGEAMLKHPDFANPAHVGFAARLEGDQRRQAARLFLTAVTKDPDFIWTGTLVELLGELPLGEVRPVFRSHWRDRGLRDSLMRQLTKSPEAEDRERFLAGLESSQPEVVKVCLHALETLPSDSAPKNLVPLLKLLQRSLREPKDRDIRAKTLALINRETGQNFSATESKTDAASLIALYQPVFAWFDKTHPDLAKALQGEGDEDLTPWAPLLAAAPWEKGSAERGAKLFRERACATCHSGSSRIGPDLTGVANRFSRDDLFTAIIAPNRDVAPPYRVSDVETRDGRRLSGIVIFESADGIILQTDAATTLRIATEDMASRVQSNRSLMPTGLLKELRPEDLADLYSYLKSLKPESAGK
jgi:putative heme-binding domain-containing protein